MVMKLRFLVAFVGLWYYAMARFDECEPIDIA